MLVALPDQLGLRFRRHLRRSYLSGEDTLDKESGLVDGLRRNHRECRVWRLLSKVERKVGKRKEKRVRNKIE